MSDILKQLDAAAELGKRAKDASRMAEAQMMDPNGRAASLASQYRYAADRIDHAAIAAALRAKDAEIDRMREALRNIADVPACSPDGQLYYEISSEDGQTGAMPVDPIGWIQDAANKARAALAPAPAEGGSNGQ